MEFFHLRAGEEFIRLGQVLKAAGFVENGGQTEKLRREEVVNCIRTTLYLTKKMS